MQHANRDFVLEFLSNAAILLVHCEPSAEDWIIYSTEEFGFSRTLREDHDRQQSDAPEEKPRRVRAHPCESRDDDRPADGFFGVMKGLPTGYNKDLQEDKEAF